MSKLRIQLKALVKHARYLDKIRQCYSFSEASSAYKASIINAIHENEKEIAQLTDTINSPDNVMSQFYVIQDLLQGKVIA